LLFYSVEKERPISVGRPSDVFDVAAVWRAEAAEKGWTE
jgi:hypothetical protein